MKKEFTSPSRGFYTIASKRCSAFTLAEVLITLGIIGVVAAMTMPTLIQSYQEKATVAKLKKVYSVVNQAYQRAMEEYGSLENWGFGEDAKNNLDTETEEYNYSESTFTNAQVFWHNMSKFMNVTHECYTSNCLPRKGDIKTLQGSNRKYADFALLKTNDGITFLNGWIIQNNSGCQRMNNICGDFAVDINGLENSPNQVGRDIFYFAIKKNKIVPMGMQDDSVRPFSNYCTLKGTEEFNGYGCTAWVIYNENMDYLHCDDLSWDGKQKCK